MSVDFNLFNSVPDEVLTTEILPRLPYTTLVSNVCFLDKRLLNLCQDPRLWQVKLANDYPVYYDLLPVLNVTPNYLYSFLHGSLSVPVIREGDRVGFVDINVSDLALSEKIVDLLFPGKKFIFFLGTEAIGVSFYR